MSSSSQQSSSYSTSDPTVISTPENQIIDQISGVASGLAQQMLGWAQGVFAQTSAVTNQAVGNFFQVSQSMLGLSGKLTDQYNNIFAPQNASLAREADSYNSRARQKMDMGMAGATQAQAGDAALRNSEEALRSYGIDPSSGRYAALDKAAAVQNAANVAGAENMQRDRDAATGQRLRSEAVQVGAMMPAAIANINNTAIQANTGASNASLANANTGANLNRLPNDYLKTAMDVKLPPIGNVTRGGSQSTGQSNSPSDPSKSGGERPGGGGGPINPGVGGQPSGQPWMPNHSSAYNGPQGGGRGGGNNYNPSSKFVYPDNGPADPYSAFRDYDPLAGVDPDNFTNNNFYQPQEGYNMNVGQPGYSDQPFDYGNNPFNDSGFGQTYDYGGPDATFGGMGGGTDTQYGNISYDPSQNAVDPGWDQRYDQPAPVDWGNGADPYTGGQQADTGGGYSDYDAGNYTPPSDSYDMGGAYAKGGPIPGAHAGPIPRQMSPSGGRQVDDVRAQGPGGQPINLNADEFVIPRDVALWKGQEFFQNLIDQSRKKRVMAPAKPTMGAPNGP